MKYSSAPLLVSDLLNLQVFPDKISCGGDHTAALNGDGSLYTWGRNVEG